MNPRVERTNRAVLTLLGLLLLAGGVLGALLGFGVFGDARQSGPVLDPEVDDFVSRNEGWFWPVVAAVAVVLGLLALRWLLNQLRTERVSELELERDRSAGSTVLKTSAVTDALSDEVEGYRGVDSARATVRGQRGRPELVLAVGLEERADLGEVRRRIESQAIGHAREALDAEDLPVKLRLRLAAARSSSRVR